MGAPGAYLEVSFGGHLGGIWELKGTKRKRAPGPLITEAERKEIDTEDQFGGQRLSQERDLTTFTAMLPSGMGARGTGLNLKGHAFGFHVPPKLKPSIH